MNILSCVYFSDIADTLPSLVADPGFGLGGGESWISSTAGGVENH